MNRGLIAIVLSLVAVFAGQGEERMLDSRHEEVVADTVPVKLPSDSVVEKNKKTSGGKRNFFKRIGDYFANSDKYDPSKKMDFGLIGGPHYNSTTGLGLGIVASGLYSLDKSDPELPLSNMSLFGDVTTTGFLMIGVRGNNIFPDRKYRLDYGLYVYRFPSKFWGIGYENGSNDNNETSYSRLKFEAKPRFLFRLARNTYLGPLLNFQYVKASKLDEFGMSLLQGQDMDFITVGGGLSFMYDSRDVIQNATRGWLVQLDQLCYPSFFGNDHEYYQTDFTLATYRRAWKGAVIAGEFHAQFNVNDVPWPMLATMGGPNRMRGYYEGRYRDKNIAELQVELRQHVWKRSGIAVWGGAANVFPSFDRFSWRHTLWNCGVGYRWAFKQNVNVRLDLGVTKHGVGFLFNINEAF